ncbi:MAG: hypothetical protein JWR42_1373 [Marmoricola sp.]|nr:hypothetical protein [Marmoricola sp.]
MTRRFQVVPAAYVVLVRAEQVLLQRRRATGYMDDLWACAAAGHVEAGESVLTAAVREAREELGVELDEADLEPITSLHRTGANGRAVDERVDWFFACRTWSGDPALQEPDKAEALRWWPLDALPEDTVPHERHVITRWHAGSLAVVETYGFDPAQAEAQAAAARG